MVKKTTPVCDFGEPAKDFRLLGTDGKYYSLADCRGEQGLLLAFICNHCPYVKAILPRLLEDARVLIGQGVGVAAICANDPTDYPEDSFERMQQLASDLKFPFPYLWDETQSVAKAYGAVCTPDLFGYNSNLRLQYRGRLDAYALEPAPQDAARECVLAMQQIIATGKGPEHQMPSMGCSIKWKNT